MIRSRQRGAGFSDRRLVGCLVCAFLLGGCAGDICYETTPRLQIPDPPRGVFGDDDSTAYFFIYSAYVRSARSVCRFPDGGRSITAHEFADFFELDLERTTLTHLGSFRAGEEFELARFTGSFGFSHRGRDRLYGYALGRPRGASTPTRDGLDELQRARMFEVEMAAGRARAISRREYDSLTTGLESIRFGETNSRGYAVELDHDLDAMGSPDAFSFILHPPGDRGEAPDTLLRGLDWLPHRIEYYLWGPHRPTNY